MGNPGEELARKAKAVAEEKKAQDVVILDVRSLTPVTDYFVIGSAPTRIQVRAIARAIRERLAEDGASLHHQEGEDDSGWVLLDYGAVVVHVFVESMRRFYDLERLWSEAIPVDEDESESPAPVTAATGAPPAASVAAAPGGASGGQAVPARDGTCGV
ncbi:MAG TPA: ribosome silencing factor [Firmicutes bacterium]|nr:ribosome silencing factor [Bacillota bacterium]